MSNSDYINSGRLDRSAAERFEVGTVQWTRRPGEGERDTLSAGFWFISPDETPGPMEVVGHADETVYIVEGHVTIEPRGGDVIDLTAGSTASLNKGAPAVWTVLEPTIEFFVYS